MRILKILGAAALIGAAASVAPRLAGFTSAAKPAYVTAAEGPIEVAAGPMHPFDVGGRSEATDPFQLKILSKVSYYIGEDYVDQARVDPTKMLQAAMDTLQREVAEIQVEYTDSDGGKASLDGGALMRVHVGSAERTFNGKVRDLDEMVVRLKEVFSFLRKELPPQSNPEQLEYAAIGGMLSTLDPHSVLLPPEVYDEMKLSTTGEFGGLGIVIAIRDSQLTVISPLDDTPASRAGIKAGDRITKIGEESTVNMALDEAVKKLRGPKGTAVTIGVQRRGMPEPREYTLIRDTIRIVNVEGQLLSENVGYVRVKGFQEETGHDVKAQIDRMRAQAPGGTLKGVVLDLRNNPGGLLDEAIKLTDLFLETGPIVTTVGAPGSRLREEKNAKWPDTDKETPVIVLTNGGSASASEIVAGALKNRDRALVLGEQTFGKGSVQNLFDLRDGSALKLTIAKYLTPGDVSIQSVGVTPDIETVPVKISTEQIDLTGESRKFRESDLDRHFDGEGAGRREKPVLALRFLDGSSKGPVSRFAPMLPKDEGREKKKEDGASGTPGGEPEEEEELDPEYRKTADLAKDFEVQLAVSLLKQAGHYSRRKMLGGANAVIAKAASDQDQKIAEEFRKLGIDWSSGRDAGTPKLSAVIDFGAPADGVAAGDEVKLTVHVTNVGTGEVSRLRGISESDEPLFDDIELAFGRLKPGQTRSWSVPMKLPKSWPASVVETTIALQRGDDAPIQKVPGRLTVKPLPRPSFAYSWQVLDGGAAAPLPKGLKGAAEEAVVGNGDGIAQTGETVEVAVTVVNQGPGESPEPVAMLKNLEGEGIFIDRGRIKFDRLAPGKSADGRFRFQVREGFSKDRFELRLTVADSVLGEYVTEKLELPSGPRGGSLASAGGRVQVSQAGTPIHAGASEKSVVLARAGAGSTLSAKAKLGVEWIQVQLPDGRAGWIPASFATPTGRAASAAGVEVVRMAPPRIAVAPRSDQLVATDERTTLQGTATDDHGIKDLWVMVNDKKVYYRTFPGNLPVREPVPFAADLPLKDGQNRITVIARDKGDLQSMASFSIRRPKAGEAAAATPRKTTSVQ